MEVAVRRGVAPVVHEVGTVVLPVGTVVRLVPAPHGTRPRPTGPVPHPRDSPNVPDPSESSEGRRGYGLDYHPASPSRDLSAPTTPILWSTRLGGDLP